MKYLSLLFIHIYVLVYDLIVGFNIALFDSVDYFGIILGYCFYYFGVIAGGIAFSMVEATKYESNIQGDDILPLNCIINNLLLLFPISFL